MLLFLLPSVLGVSGVFAKLPLALLLALLVALYESEIIPVALPLALGVSGVIAKFPFVLPLAFQTSSFIVSCFL